MQTKRGQKRKPKWHKPAKWRSWGGFKYDTNGNGMGPFFVGLAAAEFLPADPAVWLDAAMSNSMRFGPCSEGFYMETSSGSDMDTTRFLLGWLSGTIDGEETLKRWMQARRLVVAV